MNPDILSYAILGFLLLFIGLYLGRPIVQRRRAQRLEWNRPKRSGSWCKCGYCGFEGRVYGCPTSGPRVGITSPWCPSCGKNDRLTQTKINYE